MNAQTTLCPWENEFAAVWWQEYWTVEPHWTSSCSICRTMKHEWFLEVEIVPTCIKRRGPNRKTKVMHAFIITRIVGKSAGIERRDDITVFYLYFRRDCQRVYQACYCQEHQHDVVEGWSWRQRVRLKRIAYPTTALSTQNIVLADLRAPLSLDKITKSSDMPAMLSADQAGGEWNPSWQ